MTHNSALMMPETWLVALKTPSSTAKATKQAKREGRAVARPSAAKMNAGHQKKPLVKKSAMIP